VKALHGRQCSATPGPNRAFKLDLRFKLVPYASPIATPSSVAAMSRGAVGAALGVAGTTVYLRPDIVYEWARNAATTGSAVGSAAISSREMEQLTKMVRLGDPFGAGSQRFREASDLTTPLRCPSSPS
jgi:hypothetical protein